MTENVVALRRQEAPVWELEELRLGKDCSLEMVLRSDAGDAITLPWKPASKLEDFVRELLREAWDRRRSEIA
jgi:hypothetical protein